MTIEMKMNQSNFIQMLDVLFGEKNYKKQKYRTLIPLGSLIKKQVQINNVIHYFNNDDEIFLSYSEFGQMTIEILEEEELNTENEFEDWNTKIHITFDIDDLRNLWITAPNRFGKDDYDLFIFELLWK